jgi:hypothetical protein
MAIGRSRELIAFLPTPDCDAELLDLAHAELRDSFDGLSAIGLSMGVDKSPISSVSSSRTFSSSSPPAC